MSTMCGISTPKDKRRRKTYYSGQKKRHTIKTQLMVNDQGIILYKLEHKKGRRKHDYNIYKKNHLLTPIDVLNVFDLGYLCMEKDFPEQLSSLPFKKKRNQELSQKEKEYNKNHSGKRIVIEHTICRLKKYRIMNEVFEIGPGNTIKYQI